MAPIAGSKYRIDIPSVIQQRLKDIPGLASVGTHSYIIVGSDPLLHEK